MSNMKATRELGRWAAERPCDWSPKVWGIATHAWEDTIASAIAGAGDRGAETVRSTLSTVGSVPVIGAEFLTSPAQAALANGYAAHAVEMDENFLIGLGHLCTVVIPAILSVGYEAGLRGRQALDALIVASEVMARVGRAVDRAHTDRGWHGTSTIGALAAAVACGRLMGLAATEMTHALALAVSMCAGPKVQFGTEAKPLHAGLAAQAGVTAARLARNGLRASDEALEGACGFGDLYAGVKPADWSGVLPQDGEPLAIEWSGMAFKLWPSCGASHRAIAGVLALREQHGFGPEDVESVVVEVSHGIVLNLRYPEPITHKEAQFSMPYAIALALRFGRLTLADYTAEAVQDEATRRLMPRVTMVKYPGSVEGSENAVSHLPHRVTVRLKDGRCLERTVQHMKGGLGDPFTPAERRAKFDMCCASVLPPGRLEVVRGMLADPMEVPLRELMRHLMFTAGGDEGERFRRGTTDRQGLQTERSRPTAATT
jgi:2-methylcitrate dehydratase PrpD